MSDAACPGHSAGYGYYSAPPTHCPGCGRGVLTEEEQLTVAVARYRELHNKSTKLVDIRALLAVVDRLTGRTEE